MSRPAEPLVERFRTDLQDLTGGSCARLGVAVSGGPDSLALLLLAAASFPGAVEAATVDHGLRPDSAGEAEFAARLSDRLGVLHRVLRLEAPLTGNLQSSARSARYRLLEEWRQARGLDWVATAHHIEDQAETVMMRLNRGSGVGGLGAIRAVNGRVIRPLLGWHRGELAAVVEAAGIEAVADPSNADARFDRVRVRRELGAAEWIDQRALARSAAALAQADEALEWMAERLFAELATRSGPDLRLDAAGLPAELRRRLVLRALRDIDPGANPRGDEISRLLAVLEAGDTATLAGVRCSGGGLWRFAAAPPRRSG
jgi:tRNA(Ile)-lysidine synthase